MTYRILETDKSLGHALRRIGVDQLEAAIDDTRRPLDDADAAVHDIRKHCKKLRGLFRLVRPGFPDYAEENAAVRDAARMTSSLRDAGVLLKTFDALLIDTDPAPFDGLRATLAAETGRSLSEAELSAAFEQQRKALKAAARSTKRGKAVNVAASTQEVPGAPSCFPGAGKRPRRRRRAYRGCAAVFALRL